MLSQEYFQIPIKALNDYAKRIERNFQSKTATEITYYDDLKQFLEEIFPINKGYLIQSGYKIKSSSNRPDLTVIFNNIVLFHIEAKAPNTPIENIVKFEDNHRLNEQIIRYRSEGVQLLITDFKNFFLVDPSVPNKPQVKQKIKFDCILLEEINNRFKPAKNAITDLKRLLVYTCEDHLQTISNIKNLINPLADIAKVIRDKALNILIKSHLNNTNKIEKIAAKYLEDIRDDFKKSIFKEEIENENVLFSDLFAQTIVYGAFSAWMKYCQNLSNYPKFTIQSVGEFLPYGSFIRDLFLTLKGRIPLEFKSILKELETRLQKTEYKGLVNTESIITTFYSDFLNLYDPITAKNRGVVYTPHEIVDFIIQGIDFMLKRWLDMPNGLISKDKSPLLDKSISIKTKQNKITEKSDQKTEKVIERLRVLDPAAGTMAFACGLLHFAKEAFKNLIPQSVLVQGAFKKWVEDTFFNNVYAFEILMAPYVLGHIRTFLTLENLGIKLNSEHYHLNSFLMNTLMTPPKDHKIEEWIFNNLEIGREIKEALQIRDRKDIFVIMGNPPYNITSQNNCEWINEKINDYKIGLKEKNLKILSDDYVKFIRFGQWKIEEVGKGILAFITNSRYLDGQVFTIMRESLRKSFDYIYIVNLHGDMRKKESGNPFNIRVGVSIAFMVRINNSSNKKAAVFYMDVPENNREEKFKILTQGFQENRFQLLPETSKNFFIKIDTTYLDRYEKFTPINILFISNPTSGIMIGRDRLLVDVDKEVLRLNITRFFNEKFEELNNFKINVNDTKTWKKSKVFKETSLDKALKRIQFINYRGWDFRYLVYDRALVEGHRMGYIDQISEQNPAITVTKSSRKKKFGTAFIVQNLVEKCFMAVTDTSYAFPLFLNGKSNIIKPKLAFQTTPKQIFYYCYGILYSKTYRNRYDEYLRKGFPRIPITESSDLFYNMTRLGKRLAYLHLMKEDISLHLELADNDIDEWIIGNFNFKENEQTLYFDDFSIKDKNKSFRIPWIKGITKEMWNYSIGGIQQIKQFLNSRKYSPFQKYNTLQRSLTHEELIYFLKMITAIEKTIDLLPEIDRIYKRIDVLR
ncbi:MAG: type ISP restriction/modification enzyme [Candidatus Thorarchaeota archaeon]